MPVHRYRGVRVQYMRYGRHRATPASTKAAAAVGAALLLAGAGHAVVAKHAAVTPPVSTAAAVAIAYAREQLGKPYCWGGTGSACYDCSGLVMEAYQSAGVGIDRTSQDEWASEAHIPASASPQPGWLVFFPGADGTWGAPGHVALVIGPHTMIQAYATGFPVMVSSFGLPSSLEGVQAGDVIGYTDPAGVS
jgi:cell wall-associated NlpC family hydrolase